MVALQHVAKDDGLEAVLAALAADGAVVVRDFLDLRQNARLVLLDASGQPLGALGYEPGGPMPFLNTIEKAREADATSTP